MNKNHKSVLINQVIHYLQPKPGDVIVDCTVGLGGHAEEILKRLHDSGRFYGLEVDERNLVLVSQHLKNYSNAHLIHSSFENLEAIGEEILAKEGAINGIFFDLGLSSPHIDDATRGFSFKTAGPLDMRFDTRQKLTAADIVNTYPLKKLIFIFKNYGEEKFAHKLAFEIVKHRKRDPFKVTTQLADFIASCVPPRYRYGRIHPATRVFQALRIAANRELEVLEKGLYQALKILSPNGRIVIISYHSLEDRIVKNFLRGQKQAGCLTVLTKKPVCPDEKEIEANLRSRSAKLRAGEKCK